MNMSRGRGCWGRVVPEGSEAPGSRWMGSRGEREEKREEKVVRGWVE